MEYELFEKYSKEKEPTKYYKSYAWKTAIGLQKVDGLEPSEYLIKTANKNIEGDISFEDVHKLITSYYRESNIHAERVEEADKVSVRIAQIISEKSFVFSPSSHRFCHSRLFNSSGKSKIKASASSRAFICFLVFIVCLAFILFKYSTIRTGRRPVSS